MTVLVTGATGLAGSEVVRALLRRGERVRAMTRYPSKAHAFPPGVEGVVGDLDKPSTLALAFSGVRRLFLITPLSQRETEQGLAAVEAARAAGVRRLVYLSVPLGPGSEAIPHYRSKVPVEEAIRASGIPYVILRPNSFFQDDYLWCRAAVMTYGVYPQPLGSVGLHRVDIRDVADAAVHALSDPVHEGREYPVHGPEALTGPGIAETFARHLGRPVHYAGDDLEGWARQARHMMPDWMVQALKAMYRHFQTRGQLAGPGELERQERVVGHPPRSYEAFVAEIVPLWRREMASGR
ncbi:MAG: NAD-dependent epimerase/dehydratase family protein [Gammaproteobacteria bacterium]|nr:MAG: NAD-dependent epimerase/dehydratase family protein [Gammaproteobacteria bacterium]